MKISVGAYGNNGHQITRMPVDKSVSIVGVCGCEYAGAKVFSSLQDMVCDKNISLISLCSPNRSTQANDAVMCMRAGKHVYAEKPCALNEKDLDLIMKTSAETGMQFHEMADTAFVQPFLSMRRIVASGAIGKPIQIFAQKSYPLNIHQRPQDEMIDGGLLRQAGIHAFRFIEHVAGIRIKSVAAIETDNGNSKCGNLKTAASVIARLENGGVASIIINYLNPKDGFKRHGNDQLRIFGERGFIEAVDDGTKTRMIVEGKDFGAIDISDSLDYFGAYVKKLLNKGEMPLSLEDELHPTRMVIRAKEFADSKGLEF